MGFELTLGAVEKIKAICESEKKSGYGLRVRVSGGGCSGPQYQLGLEEKETEGDQVFDSNGLKIFLDPESAEQIDGGTLDFVDGPNGAGFKISNPNAKSGGGCGSHSQGEGGHEHGGGGGCGSGGCGSGGCGCG